MIKLRIAFLLFIILLSCKSQNGETLKKFLLSDINKSDFHALLKKSGISSPQSIDIKDKNLYYIYAKNYHNKWGFDFFSEYFLKEAKDKSKLFKKEAFALYLQYLSKKNKFELLKKEVRKNNNLLTEENIFLTDYSTLPKDQVLLQTYSIHTDFLPVIYDITHNNHNNYDYFISYTIENLNDSNFEAFEKYLNKSSLDFDKILPKIILNHYTYNTDYLKANITNAIKESKSINSLETLYNIYEKHNLQSTFIKSIEHITKTPHYNSANLKYFYTRKTSGSLNHSERVNVYSELLNDFNSK